MPKNNKRKKVLNQQANSKGQRPSVVNDDLGENSTHFEKLYDVIDHKKRNKRQE